MSSEPVVPVAPLGDPTEFCRACGRFATGVTIVTVRDPSGTPHGMTVNSFTSVSLAPLMFLVCIDNRSRLIPLFVPGAPVAVNILSEEQQHISSRFARPSDDRFGSIEWEVGKTGAPILGGTLAGIEGLVRQAIPAGDHTVVLTEVHGTHHREGRPLLFFSSRYQKLETPQAPTV